MRANNNVVPTVVPSAVSIGTAKVSNTDKDIGVTAGSFK